MDIRMEVVIVDEMVILKVRIVSKMVGIVRIWYGIIVRV